MDVLTFLLRSTLPVAAALLTATGSSVWAQGIALMPGETVEIIVYGRDDMSGERAIDSAGLVLVPLLGRIEAAGTTAAELEDRVEAGLAGAGLMDSPQVFIDIVRRRDVHVGGAVREAGSLPWTPGSTVEQVVTQAGGPRIVPADEFGTLLQAYATVENFKALLQSIAELQAREARLRAETAFVDLVFASSEAGGPPTEPGALPPGAGALDLIAFLPPTIIDGSAEDALPILANYDINQFRQLQRDRSDLSLVRFPDHVAEDPDLADVRSTQQQLIVDHLALRLATWNSLALQREALVRQTETYQEQLGFLEENMAALGAQLENVRTLRESGLMRESDRLNVQAAYGTLLSSHVALLSAIADTETQILQQELEIQGYGSSLRGDLGRELEAVRGQLSEARSREDEARRAATVAAAYRGTDQVAETEPQLLYQVRRGGEGDLETADPSTAVFPGDMVVVTLLQDF